MIYSDNNFNFLGIEQKDLTNMIVGQRDHTNEIIDQKGLTNVKIDQNGPMREKVDHRGLVTVQRAEVDHRQKDQMIAQVKRNRQAHQVTKNFPL